MIYKRTNNSIFLFPRIFVILHSKIMSEIFLYIYRLKNFIKIKKYLTFLYSTDKKHYLTKLIVLFVFVLFYSKFKYRTIKNEIEVLQKKFRVRNRFTLKSFAQAIRPSFYDKRI